MSEGSRLTPFDALHVFGRGGLRAPHKPLLVLYALGRLKHAGDERISFEASEEPIRDLIRAYAPPRSNARPNDPFRFLESDGCWRLDAQDRARLIDASGNARIGELRRQHVTGGFTAEWLARFRAEPALIDEVALAVLRQHFPPSLHEEILERAGLELGIVRATLRRLRNRAFVDLVREAYFGACAICGLDLRLAGDAIALEAAHIRWHALGGTDEVTNGLALCALHHRLFDRGAMTVDVEHRIRLSPHLEGGSARSLMSDLDGARLHQPRQPGQLPDPTVLRWHHRQVFHGSLTAAP